MCPARFRWRERLRRGSTASLQRRSRTPCSGFSTSAARRVTVPQKTSPPIQVAASDDEHRCDGDARRTGPRPRLPARPGRSSPRGRASSARRPPREPLTSAAPPMSRIRNGIRRVGPLRSEFQRRRRSPQPWTGRRRARFTPVITSARAIGTTTTMRPAKCARLTKGPKAAGAGFRAQPVQPTVPRHALDDAEDGDEAAHRDHRPDGAERSGGGCGRCCSRRGKRRRRRRASAPPAPSRAARARAAPA